jgi:hypothetical protein
MRLCVLLSLATVLAAQDQKPFRVQVPRMWNDAAMADLEDTMYSPRFLRADTN